MIFLEQNFWENHVLQKSLPPYTEEGDLVIGSSRRFSGPADTNAPSVTLNRGMTATLMRYLELQEQKKNAEKASRKLEQDMQRLKGILIGELGKSCTAVCENGGRQYTITYNPVRKPGIDKNGLLKLELQYPEIYREFVTVSESRRFYVRVGDREAA